MKLFAQMFWMVDSWLTASLAGVKPGTITNTDLNTAQQLKTPGGTRYYHVSNALAVKNEGAVFSVTVEAVRPNARREIVIVTDGWYETLSPMTKLFVMSHERAHIDNGDFHPGMLSGARSNGIDIEYAADKVAADYMGWPCAMRALSELRGVVKSPLFPCAKDRRAAMLDELDKRIKCLGRTEQ